ncbi:MAG: NAD-dependent epimerase/dehydratase family protein [Bradymonadaceae bacterium]
MAGRLLVLGASSLVGAHLCRRARAEGFEVTAVVQPGRPTWHVDADPLPLDVSRVGTGTTAELAAGHRVVADCWPRGRIGAPPVSPGERRRRRVGRVRRVLDACMEAGVARVVYLSEGATLGAGADPAGASERDRHVPGRGGSPRADGAFAAEAEIYRYVGAGLPVVVGVPGWILGPGDPTPDWTAPTWMAARGEWPAVWEERFSVVDARDVADGLLAALRSGRRGRRYAFGAAATDLESLVGASARRGGSAPPDRRVPAALVRRGRRAVESAVGWPAGELIDRFVSMPVIESERAEGELNWRPRDPDETIDATVDWLDAHRRRLALEPSFAPDWRRMIRSALASG